MSFYTDRFRNDTKKVFESKNTGLSFDTFYKEYTKTVPQGNDTAIRAHRFKGANSKQYHDLVNRDIDKWVSSQKKANEGKPIVPEGPIESESTQQGAKPIESQSTAKGEKPSVKPVEPTPPPQSAVGVTVPSMQDHSSNADGNTPSANRKNKRRGKRGFMITREQGQGLNI